MKQDHRAAVQRKQHSRDAGREARANLPDVDIAQKFSAFPAGFMSEGREPEAETERKGE